MKLKQLIHNLKLDYVNSDITEENFPEPEEISDEVEIIDFKREITSEEAIREMAEKGYRPANAWELFKWADKNWNGKDLVVALGQLWRDSRGNRVVLSLWGSAGDRGLRLYYFVNRWSRRCRFAFVRKSFMKTKNMKPKRIKAWAIIPAKRGAKSINKFVNGIKCDYYGALEIPQFGIYPVSVRNAKYRAEGNCNEYEKVVKVEILIPPHKTL